MLLEEAHRELKTLEENTTAQEAALEDARSTVNRLSNESSTHEAHGAAMESVVEEMKGAAEEASKQTAIMVEAHQASLAVLNGKLGEMGDKHQLLEVRA